MITTLNPKVGSAAYNTIAHLLAIGGGPVSEVDLAKLQKLEPGMLFTRLAYPIKLKALKVSIVADKRYYELGPGAPKTLAQADSRPADVSPEQTGADGVDPLLNVNQRVVSALGRPRPETSAPPSIFQLAGVLRASQPIQSEEQQPLQILKSRPDGHFAAGLFTDGRLIIEKGAVDMKLDRDETDRLLKYLDRMALPEVQA